MQSTEFHGMSPSACWIVSLQGFMKPRLAFNALCSGEYPKLTSGPPLCLLKCSVISRHHHTWFYVASFAHWVQAVDFPVQVHITKWLSILISPNCFFCFSFSLNDRSAFFSTSCMTLHLATLLSLATLLYSSDSHSKFSVANYFA